MSTPSSSINHVSKRIELLFTRFAAIYGHLWRSQFKSEEFIKFAKREWEDGLRGFSDQILDKAITETRDFSEMPPTLSQMIRNCRQVRNRCPMKIDNDEDVPRTEAVRLKHLAMCRKFLK